VEAGTQRYSVGMDTHVVRRGPIWDEAVRVSLIKTLN
jgi:hypothetical protein